MKKENGIQKGLIGLVLFALTLVVVSQPAAALFDPAAVYCEALGYKFFVAMTKRGAVAMCELPDGRQVDALDFLNGKIALEYSYCAKENMPARRDESGQICKGCLVCKLANGEEKEVIDLIDLNLRESKCGDNFCSSGENRENCPADCSSGGEDEFCDQIKDKRCDPDCMHLGGTDPDCYDFIVTAMPGTCPRPKKIGPKGTLTVAIIASANLQMTDIDTSSIRLSTKGVKTKIKPKTIELRDVGSPHLGRLCGCSKLSGDDQPDLVLDFPIKQVLRKLKVPKNERHKNVFTLYARTQDGTKLTGKNCLNINIGKTKKKKKK